MVQVRIQLISTSECDLTVFIVVVETVSGTTISFLGDDSSTGIITSFLFENNNMINNVINNIVIIILVFLLMVYIIYNFGVKYITYMLYINE